MSKETDHITAILDAAHSAASSPSTAVALQPWTPELIKHLTAAVLIFTLAALLTSAVLLWRQNAGGELVLKIFGILTIVGISAVLLVAGYSNDQLTPIVGLFGAIAGYLLGKESKTTNSAGDKVT
jgi:CHASE2 domain-containing sensor protein